MCPLPQTRTPSWQLRPAAQLAPNRKAACVVLHTQRRIELTKCEIDFTFDLPLFSASVKALANGKVA